jgi:hypothetical protein
MRHVVSWSYDLGQVSFDYESNLLSLTTYSIYPWTKNPSPGGERTDYEFWVAPLSGASGAGTGPETRL